MIKPFPNLGNFSGRVNRAGKFELIRSSFIKKDDLLKIYGLGSIEFQLPNDDLTIVFSQTRDFDLLELEQLLQSVGWSRRPMRKVKTALEHSMLKVGLWRHDPRFPRLIGFARCTGDGVIEATVWDVAGHPFYQGSGLGRQLMEYILKSLKQRGVMRVTLFADPGVVSFYKSQGWVLEPKGHKCAFWYSN